MQIDHNSFCGQLDDPIVRNDVSSAVQKIWVPLYERIEIAYELPSLEQIVSMKHVVGVSRIYYLPTFAPEDVITCVFYSGSIRLDAIQGATSLQLIDEYPFEPNLVRRQTYQLPCTSNALGIFASWSRFFDHAIESTTCATPTLDGDSYRHTFHDGNDFYDFHWGNPDPDEHSNQMQLLETYGRCIRAGRMRSWVPNLRYWRSRFGRWGP